MYRKIMVAIDDSETSRGALAEALHLARSNGASLIVAHVADATLLNLHGHVLTHMADKENAIARLSDAGRKLVDAAVADATGVDVSGLLIESGTQRVSEAIAGKARELGVDLIVVGRHGQRGLATLILGSVAEQLARMSDISVLLVRKHR